jgi:hypothetical protein
MNTDNQEYAEEVVGNAIVRTPGTRWKHPGGGARLSFELHVRGPIQDPKREEGKLLPRLTKKYVFLGEGCPPENVPDTTVVPFGESVVISSDFDNAIAKLDATRSFVMSGVAPQLRRVTQDNRAPARLHPAIDPSVAPRVAPGGAPDPGRAARLLARAAASRSAS